MPKIRLVSDFLDYYDHWFDREGHTFERLAHKGMPRRAALEYMFSLGLDVPLFGTVKELSQIPWLTNVVVYTDEMAHRGEGKLMMPLAQAIKQYPDNLATEYIPVTHNVNRGVSWRYLQIGNKYVWLKYQSDDWRSNFGNVKISILGIIGDGYHPKIHLPLFAIDFIPANHVYAIDFNTAPQIRGTGIENILPARETAEAIKRAVEEFQLRYDNLF